MGKLITFDLDGTLIDSAEDISTAIIYAAHQVCQLPENTITFQQTAPLLGKNLQLTFATLLPAAYHHRIEECVKVYREYYPQNCANHTTVFPGLIELLVELRKQGYKLAIATTKVQAVVEVVVAKLGLTAYFDLVQGVDGFPSKPDPYILQLVMQKLEATQAETLMIGDTDNDVLCARNAGIAVCAVTWGAWSYSELAKLEPDYIATSVAELCQILTQAF